jgi:predicted XRE-type DNA-binding protein
MLEERLTRTPIDSSQNTSALKAEALKLGFIKEIKETDLSEIHRFSDEIGMLANTHADDQKFQILVIDYLKTALKYLELPTIIDSFGDRPEDHQTRRETIRQKTKGNAALNAYLEDQKLSKSRLGNTLTIFSDNVVPFLYPPPHEASSAELDAIAVEAAKLKEEIEAKFGGEAAIPLSEKEDLVEKTSGLIKRGLSALLKAYG